MNSLKNIWIFSLFFLVLSCNSSSDMTLESKKEAFIDLLNKYGLDESYVDKPIEASGMKSVNLQVAEELFKKWAPMIKHLKPQREFMDHMWKMDDNASNQAGLSEEEYMELQWDLRKKLHSIQEEYTNKSLDGYEPFEYYDKQLEIRSSPKFKMLYSKEDLMKLAALLVNVQEKIDE